MMKRTLWLFTFTLAFLFTASTIVAQEGGQSLQGQNAQQAQQFVGQQVVNQQGEQLGTVDLIIVDSNTGNLQYLILSSEEGENITIAVENLNQQGQQLVANFDASKLSQLAGDQDFQQQTQMLSQILGKQVTGLEGNTIGTVSNLVIGEQGEYFVIVSGQDNQNYPIPLNAVQQGPQESLQANVSQQNLQQAPSYQGEGFPDLANQRWQQELSGYYARQEQQTQRDIIQEQVTPEEATGADILVSQPAPQIRVSQRQPEIAVTQPPPRVIVKQKQPQIQVQVTQPEPEIQVIQPEPEVAVDTPKPQVQVQTPEPRVAIEETEPNVEVRTPDPQVSVRQTDKPQIVVQRQGQPQIEMVEPEGEVQVDVDVREANQLIGMTIYNDQGNQLGTVNDVIGAGDQSYILMSSAENDRIYPLPMQQVQDQNGQLVTEFDQQQLQNAPSFTRSELEQMNQENFNQEVRAYYGEGQGN